MKEIIPTPEEERLIAIDDRIDRFLKGQMTDEESTQFILDCKSNPELKERAVTTTYLVKALRQ
jgi:hypothetical protein